MIEYVRYRIPTEQAAEFAEAYRRTGEQLRLSRHHRRHEVAQCVEEPERWTVRIEWDSIDGHLQGFRNAPEFRQFLQHVSPYIQMIEEMQHYQVVQPPPTLYEWAGEIAALRRWLGHFYGEVERDELLRELFTPMPPEHVEHVALWVGEVLGGPPAYTDTRGGHPAMIARHGGRRITEAQRRRWLELLLQSADEVGLPDDPEFRASIVSYFEWGTRLAVVFSADPPPPPTKEPTPIWDWVRPPWQPSAGA